jgi:hypothetical protein
LCIAEAGLEGENFAAEDLFSIFDFVEELTSRL